jgi:periplasmic divalent cation tolerance protein
MYTVIFITVGDGQEAASIARALVEERLAACVNILGGVHSIFRWGGRVDEAEEILLIVKSSDALLEDIVKRVKDLHGYSNPEIVALPVIGGSGDYLDWVTSSLEGQGESNGKKDLSCP